MSIAPHHGIESKKARIAEVAAKNPDMLIMELVERLGVSSQTVRSALGPEECARRTALWRRSR